MTTTTIDRPTNPSSVRYGTGLRHRRLKHDGSNSCRGCSTPPGRLHLINCENEACPVCSARLVSCPCGAREYAV